MKLISILFLFIVNQTLGLENNKSKTEFSKDFVFSLTTYNHSDKLIRGILNYTIKNKTLKITRFPLYSKKGDLIYSGNINKNTIKSFQRIKLDKLLNYYSNDCVIRNSGSIFKIKYENEILKKEIYIHHYYLDEIDYLINNINKIAPKKYKVQYISSETKQNCI